MLFHKPITIIVTRIVLAFTLAILTFAAYADIISPRVGSTITQSPVSMAWTGDGTEYWVRVYDPSSDRRLFDSGRLNRNVTNLSFPLSKGITSVEILLYVKISAKWALASATYNVDLSEDPQGPTGSDNDTLAELECDTGEIALYNGSFWLCAQPADDCPATIIQTYEQITGNPALVLENPRGPNEVKGGCSIHNYSGPGIQSVSMSIIKSNVAGLDYFTLNDFFNENANNKIFDIPLTRTQTLSCLKLLECNVQVYLKGDAAN